MQLRLNSRAITNVLYESFLRFLALIMINYVTTPCMIAYISLIKEGIPLVSDRGYSPCFLGLEIVLPA